MSKGNQTENDILALIFNGTPLPWAAITNLFISLHTADPGEAGTQLTAEATYTGYARVAVPRTALGFAAPSAGSTANVPLIQFPQCTAGTNALTHLVIGTAATGAGQIIYSGALSSALNVSAGIQPQFAAGQIVTLED